MSWPKTLYGAWLVLRANMQWAPFPDNDPDGARATMARFYRLLGARHSTRSAPPSSRSSGGARTARTSTATTRSARR